VQPKQYLTVMRIRGVRSHFVDEVKMAQMAHDIPLEKIPPMIQIRPLQEDEVANGRTILNSA